MSTPTPRTDTEITFTGTYTCTHHNDAERTACPVCLVAALTAERDQLRAELAAETWHKERANWREEVGQLKLEIFNLSLELQQWKSTVRKIEECCDKPSNVWDIANTALSAPNT